MIIKSSSRGSAKRLADHLCNSLDNEEVRFTESRGLVALDVHGSLDDMELLARENPRCRQFLHHVSINPDATLTGEQWQQLWEKYEAEYGLTEQPFIAVTHSKGGRAHQHRVYLRVDVETGKAVHFAHTYPRNEKLARLFEYELGRPCTLGRHNRAVMSRLREEGRAEVVTWMERALAHAKDRPIAQKSPQDHQIEQRLCKTAPDYSMARVEQELQDAWQRTDSGKSFEAALAEKGYVLARGDSRDFVILDPEGTVHSPPRRLKVKVKELREKWADLQPEHLPTVAAAKQARREREQPADPEVAAPQEQRQALLNEREQVDDEIAALEAQITLQREEEALYQAALERLEQFSLDDLTELSQILSSLDRQRAKGQTTDERQQRKPSRDHHQQVPWGQSSPSGRGDRPEIPEGRSEPIAKPHSGNCLERRALHLQGRAAAQEEERRCRRAAGAADYRPRVDPEHRHGVREYLRCLGRKLKSQGQAFLADADRQLAIRLSRLGYSREAIQQVILRASPALLQRPPSARSAYLRQVTAAAIAQSQPPTPPQRSVAPYPRYMNQRQETEIRRRLAATLVTAQQQRSRSEVFMPLSERYHLAFNATAGRYRDELTRVSRFTDVAIARQLIRQTKPYLNAHYQAIAETVRQHSPNAVLQRDAHRYAESVVRQALEPPRRRQEPTVAPVFAPPEYRPERRDRGQERER